MAPPGHKTFKPLNTREHFQLSLCRIIRVSPVAQCRTLTHLIVKIPLDVQLLVLGAGEGEAAGQVHPLLPPVLEDSRTRDVDIRDAVTSG